MRFKPFRGQNTKQAEMDSWAFPSHGALKRESWQHKTSRGASLDCLKTRNCKFDIKCFMALWQWWSLVLIATKISDITDSYECALMLLWCRKTRDQLTFLLWKRQNFKFAWADRTACLGEQLWGGDAHRSVNFDIKKTQTTPDGTY